MKPSLRFRRFTDDWKSSPLNKIASIHDGTHQTPSYVEKGVPFYSVEQLTADNFKDTKFVTESVYRAEQKRISIEKGDILMTRIGDIGTAKYIDWDVRASFYVSLALIKASKTYSGAFLEKYISTDQFRRELWRRTIHVAFPKKINLGEIGNCTLHIPVLEEQQKIADFLTVIDKQIAIKEIKIKLLRQYYKGISQRIINQTIQFKDEGGRQYPKWQTKRLSELLRVNTKQRAKNIDRSKILTVKLHRKGVAKSKNVDSLSIGATTYYERDAGDLIYGKQNLFSGAIAIIPESLDGYLSSGDVPSLKIVKQVITPEFLLSYIGREVYYKKLEAVASGSGSKRIHEATLLSQSITIPCIEEQQKITAFFASLERKIKSEENDLDSIKKWKRGLLQKMFV